MSYKEVETLEDHDGAIAVITESDAGYLSFRVQKQFVDNSGEVKATSYLGRRHIPAIRRLCDQLEDRLDVHVDRLKIERARTGG
jgi:hypothetical protein